MAVEAKSGEPLDELVKDWWPAEGAPSRKPERLKALQAQLGIPDQDVMSIRYQLLHRAASALKEATRFGARAAILLIQSFNRAADVGSWEDCRRFGQLLGLDLCEGSFALATVETAVPLYFGWVHCTCADGNRLTSAV